MHVNLLQLTAAKFHDSCILHCDNFMCILFFLPSFLVSKNHWSAKSDLRGCSWCTSLTSFAVTHFGNTVRWRFVAPFAGHIGRSPLPFLWQQQAWSYCMGAWLGAEVWLGNCHPWEADGENESQVQQIQGNTMWAHLRSPLAVMDLGDILEHPKAFGVWIRVVLGPTL